MIINLAQIKDGASEEISEMLNAKELDLEYVDLHYKKPIEVRGNLEKISNTATFRGIINRDVEHTCARCLKITDERLSDPIELTYDISDKTELDLTDDLRDAILLSHCERFLCNESCKGLCPNCGIDLNVNLCQCTQKNDAKPFAKLKKFLNET